MKYSQVAFIAAAAVVSVSANMNPFEGVHHISGIVQRRGEPDGGSSSSSTSTDATPGGGAAAVAETKPQRDHKKNKKNSKEHKDKDHKHNRNRNHNHNHNQGAGSGEASRRRRRPHRLPQNTPGSTGSGSEGAGASNLNAQSTTTSTPTSTSDASPASVRRSLNFGRQELSIRDLVDFDDELHARSPTEGDGNSGALGDANSGGAAGPHHRHQGHHGGEGAEAEPHRQHHHHSRPSEAGSLRRRIYDFGREDLVMRDLAELELGLHARAVVAAAAEQGENGSGSTTGADVPPAAAGSTGETKPRYRHHRPGQAADAETQGSSQRHRHHHPGPGRGAEAETQESSQHPYHHHQSHSEQPTTASSFTSTTTSSDASHLVRRDLAGSEGDEQLVARLFENIKENYRQIKAARLAAKTAKWQAKAGGAPGGAPGGGSSDSGDSSNSRRGLFEDGFELDARGFEDDSLTERSVTDLAKAVWHNHKQNKALRLQRQSQLDAGKAASINMGSGMSNGGDGSGGSSQNGRRDFVDDELEMRDFVDDEEIFAREPAGSSFMETLNAVSKTFSPPAAPHDAKLGAREWFDELDTRGFEIEEMD